MLKASINKIIPFSNVDGPGNRLSIFFQTCNFRCWYCHNPETINPCIHCGVCVKTCPSNALTVQDGKVVWEPMLCTQCDTCIKVCPHLSSPKTSNFTVEDIITQIMKVKPFIVGITTSGGECTLNTEFLTDLFLKVGELNLTTLIDSNGNVLLKDYPEFMNACDGVMLDVKAVSSDFHKKLTGHDNKNVLSNLDYLLSINKLEEVRIVCLPHYTKETYETIEYVMKRLNGKSRLKLIRYRKYGVRTEGLNFFNHEELKEKDFEKFVDFAKSFNQSNVVTV